MLIDNPTGNFKFLKGFGPFSSGGVAHSGYEIVHMTFHSLPSWQRGVERFLFRGSIV